MLLGEKRNQQSYPAVNLVSYNNHWPSNICRLVQQWQKCHGSYQLFFLLFKAYSVKFMSDTINWIKNQWLGRS